MRFRDSIRARLLGLSALLIGAALVAGYLAIGAILDRFITDRFDAEAAAVSDTLIAGADIDAEGRLITGPAPTDPRFAIPVSGWFWQLTQDGRVVAKSDSLLDAVLGPPAPDLGGGPDISTGTGPEGEDLRMTHHGFTLPGSRAALAVTVTAPQAEIDQSIARLRRPLAISLAVLGLALIVASVAQVMAGLSSLDRLGRDLRAIRAGQAEALPLPAVSELRPIAAEINGLLEQNRAVLARAREHIGNLAHSLKTPLAALDNTLPAGHRGHALVARMDRQIGWHLRRARSSGAARTLGHRTDIASVTNDILLVLRGPISLSEISVVQDIAPGLAFAGERQDLEEMLGNLIENAIKWTSTQLLITARISDRATDRATHRAPHRASDNHANDATLVLRIEDDGPGMADDDHARAIARGGRLDEAGPPGSGLGLAIVADLAALHGGRLTLERSALGGLAASLTLPA